ncbi:MAG: hypothetical protein AAB263_08525 [Planctomycetota bacterium]
MSEFARLFNACEAVLWACFAVVFVVRAVIATGRMRRLAGIMALAFIAFSISDVIEMDTGAWWRPIWLLVLKVSCVLVFIGGVIVYYRMRRRSQSISLTAHGAASNSTSDDGVPPIV